MSKKLIIRLSGQGQYELPADETLLVELNKLDNEIVALLAQAESEVRKLLEKMAAPVKARGAVVDDVVASDLILPPTDLTLVEAAALFQGEGLIPG